MFFQSQQPILQSSLLQAMLAALNTRPAAALLATPHLHLYSAASVQLNPAMTVAQFTECDFVGYAAVSLASFIGPVNLPAGGGQGIYGEGNFIAGSGIVAPGQNAMGYWVDDGATAVYLCEKFPAAVPFVNPGDFLDLVAFFAMMFSVVVEVG